MNENTKSKVLIAVDGSDRSLEAVRYAAGLVSSETTEVVLFHVMNRRPEGAWFWELEKVSEPRQDLDVLEDAANRHEKHIQKLYFHNLLHARLLH